MALSFGEHRRKAIYVLFPLREAFFSFLLCYTGEDKKYLRSVIYFLMTNAEIISKNGRTRLIYLIFTDHLNIIFFLLPEARRLEIYSIL